VTPAKFIMGVDFGLRRVGLAISGPAGAVAVGAGRIEGLTGRALARAIAAAARQRGAQVIVVGAPAASGRDADRVARGADSLSEALEKLGFQVEREVEDFTTATALADRARVGGKSSAGKGWTDEAAAFLILINHLDRRMLRAGEELPAAAI